MEKAEREGLVAQPALEDSNNSSTDTCLTLLYGSDSSRPFPPSPVHSVTDSPIKVSPLVIITSDSSYDDSSHIPTTCMLLLLIDLLIMTVLHFLYLLFLHWLSLRLLLPFYLFKPSICPLILSTLLLFLNLSLIHI